MAGLWRSLSLDLYPMKQPVRLVRLNLHLRADHLARLTCLATAISRRKGRDTRLAEALELALVCSGQLIPDTVLSFSSVFAGANPSLN
jgi:hypothetical protein